MLNDQRIPNDAMTNTDVRRPHWSLGFGHSLVIGHWSLVIQRTVRDSSSSSSSSSFLHIGRRTRWVAQNILCSYLGVLVFTASAPAQPIPKLNSISPEWIQ